MTTEWIQTILTFFIGYALGNGKLTKENVKKAEDYLKKKILPHEVGVVTRPSPEKLKTWANPTKEAEEEAFKESFTKDIGDPTKI